MHPDVLVIGAGFQGCSVALQLALRGANVTVVEKQYPAAHASGVNAGSVHHIARLLRELPLAQLTLNMWKRIGDIVDSDCGYKQVGHLKLAENESDLEYLAAMREDVAANCTIHEDLIGRDELRRMEPNVAANCVGGIYSRDCGYALPARTVDAFRSKAERMGVSFVLGEAVDLIRKVGATWQVTTSGRRVFNAKIVVNCAGAWANQIAAQVGDVVKLTPLALQMAVLARMPMVMNTVIAFARRILSVKQFDNGTVVIGGGFRGRPDLVAGEAHLDLNRTSHNLLAASQAYPKLAEGRLVRCWGGLCAMTPDSLPIISASGVEDNLWHAFGFSQHGFYLGPAVGMVLAEAIGGKTPTVSLEPFSIGRFAQALPR